MLARPDWVAAVSAGTDPAAAAALAMNALTGAQAVDLTGPIARVGVLIVGPSGPVGATAVHTSLHAGANVYVTVSGRDAIDWSSLGVSLIGRAA